ncbi:MAG TPA: hypothetical protein HA282_00390 [Nanoarchaeota archaeon]|nr:hypothetical protein [Nanoarchaeota archaeon]
MPQPYKPKKEFLRGLECCIDVYDRKPRQMIRRITRWKGGLEEEIDRLKPTKNSGQEIEYLTDLARVLELEIAKERDGGPEDPTPIENIIYGSVGAVFFGYGAYDLFARQNYDYGALAGFMGATGVVGLIGGIRGYKEHQMRCKKKQEKEDLDKKLMYTWRDYPDFWKKQHNIWKKSWY